MAIGRRVKIPAFFESNYRVASFALEFDGFEGFTLKRKDDSHGMLELWNFDNWQAEKLLQPRM